MEGREGVMTKGTRVVVGNEVEEQYQLTMFSGRVERVACRASVA